MPGLETHPWPPTWVGRDLMSPAASQEAPAGSWSWKRNWDSNSDTGGPGDNMVTAPSVLVLALLLLLTSVPAGAHSVFLEDVVGSGEAEGSSASSPSLPPPRTPALSPTSLGPQPTPLAGPSAPTSLLDGIVDFFRQYVLLIAVVGSLAFLLLFVVCAALITRQQHKASAYYPSSFPKKKYVDQSDRAGGPRAFSEVPDRAPDSRPEEALDSSQQLQADILAATQNLKSLARVAPGSREGARLVEGRAKEEEKEEVKEEVEQGTQQVHPETQGRGVPAEKPEVEEELCTGVAGSAVAAGEGQGEPEESLSLAQEAPMGPPGSPCACSAVSPSV